MHYFKQYFILIKTHDQMLAGNVESYTVGMLALFFFFLSDSTDAGKRSTYLLLLS